MAIIWHSVWRGIVAMFSFAIPMLYTTYPNWESITIGGIVFMVLHFAEKQLNK